MANSCTPFLYSPSACDYESNITSFQQAEQDGSALRRLEGKPIKPSGDVARKFLGLVSDYEKMYVYLFRHSWDVRQRWPHWIAIVVF